MVKKVDIARGLGISPAAVTKAAKRGMPTTSLEAARRWREVNVDPVRSLGQRLGRTGSARPGPGRSDVTSAVLAEVDRLAMLAAQDFAQHESALRGALRRVPLHARLDRVLMAPDLMHKLIDVPNLDRWGRLLDRWDAEAGATRAEPARGPSSESGDEWAHFLYRLASGEEVVAHIPLDDELQAPAARATP